MLRCGLRLCVVFTSGRVWRWPIGFTFTIGNPVASQDFRFKTAAFALRTEGCADPAKAQITGTAEGHGLNGARRSVVLNVMAASKPGVYAVEQKWPPGGHGW